MRRDLRGIAAGIAAATAFLATNPASALQCLVPVGQSSLTFGNPRISDPSGGEWLVDNIDGLFRYTGEGLVPVPGGNDPRMGPVHQITLAAAANGERLLATSAGLYRYMQGTLTPITGGESARTYTRYQIAPPIGSVWLVLAGNVVFRYADGRLTPLSSADAQRIGTANSIGGPVDGTWLVGGSNGLFRMTATELTPVASAQAPGAVYEFLGPVLGAWLVAADSGLFRYSDGALAGIAGSGARVPDFLLSGEGPLDGAWLLSWNNGLYLYSGDSLTLIARRGGEGGGPAYDITAPVAGGWLVDAENNVFHYQPGGRLVPVPGGTTAGSVLIHSRPLANRMLIAGFRGTFLYANGRLSPVAGGDYETTDRVSAIVGPSSPEEVWLAGTSNGLFQFAGDRLVRIPGAGEEGTGRIERVSRPARGLRLVSAANGLFKYLAQPQVRATPRSGNPTAIEANRPTTLAWIIDGDCAADATDEDFRLGIDGGTPQPAPFRYDRRQRQLILELPAEFLPGERTLTLYAVNASGQPYVVSNPISLGRSLDWTALAALLGKVALVVHSIFFLGLIVAARWSDRAAAMLLHPLSRSIGLWFGWALTFFPAVQLWLLGRWFDNRKAKFHARPVHPLPVTGGKPGETFASTELVGKLHPTCRLWLEGKPGMGKTTVAHEIEERFFAEANSLRQGLRRFGYVPLFVRLRSLAGAGLQKGDRLWPARVAEAVLGGQGFIVDESASGANLSFIAAILKRSKFVLLLDGANEVPWDKELLSAAGATDRPGFLVTSQMTPAEACAQFDCYSLPETMEGAVEPLLKLFLDDDDEGGRLFRKLAESPLIADIKSGYDVRLVESLHRSGAGELPKTRVALYDAIIGRLFTPERAGGTPDRLYAFAWDMWLKGERQFTGEELDRPLLDALRDATMPVVRIFEGATLEFRHDQMRGYLAARHVHAAVNPLGLLEKSEAKWPQARSEQDLVWQFLCEIIDDDAMARRIYLWTLDKPDDRVALQAAFRGRVGVPDVG